MERRKPFLPSRGPRFGPPVSGLEERSRDVQFVQPTYDPGQSSRTRIEQPTTDLDDWPSAPQSHLPASTAEVPSDRGIETSKWAGAEEDESTPLRDKGKGKQRDNGEQQEPLDEVEAVSDAFCYGVCCRSELPLRLSWKHSRTARTRTRPRPKGTTVSLAARPRRSRTKSGTGASVETRGPADQRSRKPVLPARYNPHHSPGARVFALHCFDPRRLDLF